MNHKSYKRRLAALLPAALLATALGACSDLLDVQNPGAVLDEQLGDTVNASLMASTVVSDFQYIYDDIARNSSWFSDEMVTGHNFVGYREWDGRIMKEERTELHSVYTFLHQARFSADTLAGRFNRLFPQPTAEQSLDLARMRAYGGYSYVLLGELFCESPLQPDAAAVSSDDILRRGIKRFEQAIAAASTAKAGGVRAARADSLLNLARVGAARAYLDLGNKAKAIEFASQVPAGFEFRTFYGESKDALENIFFASSNGANQNLGVDVTFRNLNDRRVLHTRTSRTGHNGATPLFRPYQAPSFSGWVASGDTVPFQKTTSIRFSSGLEARYIVAEAGGMTDAQLLAFLNERRAVGGQPALTALPANPQAELRDQRRRDFFLDGHRVGDLRRYKRFYGVDQWPKGQHPDPFIGTYGTAECFVPQLNEKLGNPAY
ncbi:MAG TPA: hypothetical protein VGR37_19605 [Longimicrobiaceae bacterium]|nr:hypothetical protein [Longimicrobiaceae bacterium]